MCSIDDAFQAPVVCVNGGLLGFFKLFSKLLEQDSLL